MAYLTLPQVQDMMLRKRRRDKGNPYLEERFALSDTDRAGIYGLLDGQALSGVNIVDEYEEYPNRIGQYTRWYGNPNTGRPGRDEVSIRSDVAGTDFQDVLAHEVGHRGNYLSGLLGTQAGPPRAPVRPFVEGVPQLGIENRTAWVGQVDPYVEQERMYTPDKSDRWHNVLYGMEGDRRHGYSGDDPYAEEMYQGILASDIDVANQLARNVPKRDVITYPKGQPTSLLSTDAPAPKTALSAQEGVSEGITMDELRHHASHIKSKAGNLVSTVKEMFKGEPTSIKEAQAQGKSYFMKDGKKQLAVTGEQLAKFKKSDLYDADSKKSALSQWANIAQSEGGMDKLFKKKSDKQVAAEVKETKNEQFLDDYMQKYYTGEKKDDPEFREDIKARLKGTVPDKHPDGTPGLKKTVANAISSAVKIFGTDKLATGGRMDETTMKKMLQDLGQIESGYRTRIAGGGRPERGFWQVLPSTAKDALTNAGAYFGKTFNKTFAGRDWVKSGQSAYESLKNMSQKEISKLLESDDDLGAAFSAVQVLRTFKKKK